MKVRAVSFEIERDQSKLFGTLVNYGSFDGNPGILIDADSRESTGRRIDLWSSDRQETTSPGAGSN